VSFFTDWRSHYTAGLLYGLRLRVIADPWERRSRLRSFDLWAFDREWRQNLAGKHPNAELSAKQLREATAWGAGARRAAGFDEPYPSPPYPEGVTWVA
jgi:hypothetical protein